MHSVRAVKREGSGREEGAGCVRRLLCAPDVPVGGTLRMLGGYEGGERSVSHALHKLVTRAQGTKAITRARKFVCTRVYPHEYACADSCIDALTYAHHTIQPYTYAHT